MANLEWIKNYGEKRRVSPFELNAVDYGNYFGSEDQPPPMIPYRQQPSVRHPMFSAESGTNPTGIDFGNNSSFRFDSPKLPALSTAGQIPGVLPSALQPAVEDNHADTIRGMINNIDTPPPLPLKKNLIGAAIMAAPTALGGIFGGMSGATGAAQGTLGWIDQQRDARDKRRNQLAQELENELKRQQEERKYLENIRQFGLTHDRLSKDGELRSQVAADRAEYQTAVLEHKRLMDGIKAENETRRVEGYLKNINDLIQGRSEDRILKAQELERKINSDENLDSHRKAQLSQQLSIAMMNEGGRNSRNTDNNDASMEREQLRQDAMNERAGARQTNSKTIWDAIEKVKKNPDFQYMTPEQQEREIQNAAASIGVEDYEAFIDTARRGNPKWYDLFLPEKSEPPVIGTRPAEQPARKSNSSTVTLPDGRIITFKSPEEAEAFRRDAGIQ